MSIKLIVLGSGPSEAIPRTDCRCPTCLDARKPRSKSRRTRSSIVLKWHNKNILIDCGPDFEKQIKKEGIGAADAVFLTHGHADAVGGLQKLMPPDDALKILAEKQTLKYVKRVYGKIPPNQIIKPAHSLKIYNLTITPFRVKHALREKIFPTLGFKLGPLVYASDVSSIPKSSEKYFENAGVLFLDGAMWLDKKMPWHLSVEQAINLSKKFHVKKLYLTQIGHSYPPHEIAQ
ncbi:MBL fold metallo-hydrolase, partial [Patescibacteria group bacterium]|nr:MBL fold metallo-hydrolase [Patescibacteria group bacterium]